MFLPSLKVPLAQVVRVTQVVPDKNCLAKLQAQLPDVSVNVAAQAVHYPAAADLHELQFAPQAIITF